MIRTALLIKHNPGDTRLLREMFHEQDSHSSHLTRAESMGEAESFLSRQTPDIILLELGLEAVRRAHSAASSRVPLDVLTNDEALAAQALQAVAQDYHIKGQIERRGLLRALAYAVEQNIMEEPLFTEKERARVTLNSIEDGVACMDKGRWISFINGIVEWLTGWSRPTRRPSEVLRIIDASRSKVQAGTDQPLQLPSKKFRVDVLKIDQSFVRPIGTVSDDDTPVVIAVIAITRSLKLRVIAEGVETLQELESLRNPGCDEAQGYYWGRPVPAQSFTSRLSASIQGPPVVFFSPEAVA